MPEIEHLDDHFEQYRFHRYIDRGAYGQVYAISRNHVVKVPRFPERSFWSFNAMVDELDICQRLYDHGIQVPKPEGIFRVNLRHLLKRNPPETKGIVMERLRGKEGYKLKGSLRERASQLLDEEIKKSINIGFFPKDYCLYNTVYDPKSDRLHLLDFGAWKLPEQ
jgi:RIO-like serine/threonine protein kinase